MNKLLKLKFLFLISATKVKVKVNIKIYLPSSEKTSLMYFFRKVDGKTNINRPLNKYNST